MPDKALLIDLSLRGGDGSILSVSLPLHMTQVVVGPLPWALVGPFTWALDRPFPTERSKACSERSDEVRGCKLHTTKVKGIT